MRSAIFMKIETIPTYCSYPVIRRYLPQGIQYVQHSDQTLSTSQFRANEGWEGIELTASANDDNPRSHDVSY